MGEVNYGSLFKTATPYKEFKNGQEKAKLEKSLPSLTRIYLKWLPEWKKMRSIFVLKIIRGIIKIL